MEPSFAIHVDVKTASRVPSETPSRGAGLPVSILQRTSRVRRFPCGPLRQCQCDSRSGGDPCHVGFNCVLLGLGLRKSRGRDTVKTSRVPSSTSSRGAGRPMSALQRASSARWFSRGSRRQCQRDRRCLPPSHRRGEGDLWMRPRLGGRTRLMCLHKHVIYPRDSQGFSSRPAPPPCCELITKLTTNKMDIDGRLS